MDESLGRFRHFDPTISRPSITFTCEPPCRRQLWGKYTAVMRGRSAPVRWCARRMKAVALAAKFLSAVVPSCSRFSSGRRSPRLASQRVSGIRRTSTLQLIRREMSVSVVSMPGLPRNHCAFLSPRSKSLATCLPRPRILLASSNRPGPSLHQRRVLGSNLDIRTV